MFDSSSLVNPGPVKILGKRLDKSTLWSRAGCLSQTKVISLFINAAVFISFSIINRFIKHTIHFGFSFARTKGREGLNSIRHK